MIEQRKIASESPAVVEARDLPSEGPSEDARAAPASARSINSAGSATAARFTRSTTARGRFGTRLGRHAGSCSHQPVHWVAAGVDRGPFGPPSACACRRLYSGAPCPKEPSSSSVAPRTRSGTASILSRFVALAGGPDAHDRRHQHRLVARPRGRRALSPGVHRAGRRAASGRCTSVTRPQANDETAALAVRDATGIFLTGGNQLRLSSTIGGTRLAEAILDALPGTAPSWPARAPGASAMSSHMIAFGASGATPKQRMAQIAAGLGAAAGRDHRPAFPAAEPARPAALAHRPEPEPAGSRRRRGHGRRRRARTTSWTSSAAAASRSSMALPPRPTHGRCAATGR